MTSPQENHDEQTASGTKRTPTRTCIGCRTRRDDIALVRIASDQGDLTVDDRGSGRGAWLCRDGLAIDAACIEAAARSKAFSRAFRSKLVDRVCADTLLGWPGKPTH